MSLTAATLFLAIFLFLFGNILLWNAPSVRRFVNKVLRSRIASLITFGSASVWFLFQLSQLGDADFGQYKHLLMLFFGAIAVLAFFFVPDFLSVRGLSILILLISWLMLKSAYMQWEYPARLLMVGFVYASIILAFYFGTVPYRMRDFFDWLFFKNRRVYALGSFFIFYGVILCGAALSYQ